MEERAGILRLVSSSYSCDQISGGELIKLPFRGSISSEKKNDTRTHTQKNVKLGLQKQVVTLMASSS